MFSATCCSTAGRAFLAVFDLYGVLSSGFHEENLSGAVNLCPAQSAKRCTSLACTSKCASGRGFQTKSFETGVHIGKNPETCTHFRLNPIGSPSPASSVHKSTAQCPCPCTLRECTHCSASAPHTLEKKKHVKEKTPLERFQRLSRGALGWMMGLEPTTLGTTIRCSTS